jgi:hypothetical protein
MPVPAASHAAERRRCFSASKSAHARSVPRGRDPQLGSGLRPNPAEHDKRDDRSIIGQVKSPLAKRTGPASGGLPLGQMTVCAARPSSACQTAQVAQQELRPARQRRYIIDAERRGALT